MILYWKLKKISFHLKKTVRESIFNKNCSLSELLSPVRPTRAAAAVRNDYKHFFVEDTPDEKYTKRVKKEPKTDGYGDEEDEEKTVLEEIDEEVKQTPVAKLRQSAAKKSGKRYGNIRILGGILWKIGEK